MGDIKAVVDTQRAYFDARHTRPVDARLACLKRLENWLRTNEAEILAALRADLNKAPFEAYATELGIVLDELRFVQKRLRGWCADRRVPAPLKQFPSRCFVRPEPYGVTLILSPWNYPFLLTVTPLIAALAAGNCAVVKPSAYSPATSALLSRMAREAFHPGQIAVIEGGRKENEALLGERFDYIFFTGSVAVGKTVMEAAAQHLTPVTLELGGKSPCIVDETAHLATAAKRIAWGKFINAGQTCVAPDYLLVHRSVKDALVRGITEAVGAFYGGDALQSAEYGRIVNEKHFDRLLGLLEGAQLLCGGRSDRGSLRIAPTLVDGVDWDSPVMREEIFGPILPVLEFDALAEAVRQINAHPKPLALYVFSGSKGNQEYVLNHTFFGGGCVNDTVVHLSTPRMPFGGVGESGMGSYHGKAGFDTFTHYKSILSKSQRVDVPLRYPPYKNHLPLLKKL